MRLHVMTMVAVAMLVGCGVSPGGEESPESTAAEQALVLQPQATSHHEAGGAFSCDFGISAAAPPDQLPPQIERDRTYMSARPGFIEKHIPFSIDTATGELQSGGRYLFETRQDAVAYHRFVAHDYVLDGVQFLARPIFLAPECHDWAVVGHQTFTDLHTTDVVMRTERFTVKGRDVAEHLAFWWPALRREAARRGYSAVELLYDRDERLASLVYYAGRAAAPDPTTPDFASLDALAQAAPLGRLLEGLDCSRTFDRTQWVLTIWFPFQRGDHGAPSLWPNSPPLPAPSCGDGVCEVSRGESAATCTSDCPRACGDGRCQAGEDTVTCPGDCRL